MTEITDVWSIAAREKISRSGFLPNAYESAPNRAYWENDASLKMIDHARAFIRAGDRERYKRPEYSSLLKHHAERWRGEGAVPGLSYVINGAFLIACFLEGLKPRWLWFEDDRGRRLTMSGKVRLP